MPGQAECAVCEHLLPNRVMRAVPHSTAFMDIHTKAADHAWTFVSIAAAGGRPREALILSWKYYNHTMAIMGQIKKVGSAFHYKRDEPLNIVPLVELVSKHALFAEDGGEGEPRKRRKINVEIEF